MNFNDAHRWWQLLRHHRPSQLWGRGVKRLRQGFGRPRKPTPGIVSLRPDRSPLDRIAARRILAWNFKLQQFADNLVQPGFTYLNQARNCDGALPWRSNASDGISDLWRFHLYYQDDLLAVCAQPENAKLAAAGREFLRAWIAGNPYEDPRVDRDAWHPFCISRRIINWVLAWDALWGNAANEQSPRTGSEAILDSLATQALVLLDNLEWDLRGNHLLVNLHALAIGAAFFDGKLGERCLAPVRQHLPAQLREQILPWGEHFERSPMYHAQMLEAMLDIRDALAGRDPPLSQSCAHAAKLMAEFLAGMLHPDGHIPLLGDSAFDETPDVSTLIAAAGVVQRATQSTSRAARIGDYWTFRDGGDFLLFDAGPVGADELPAHAHCDLLGFEASFAGQRVFVDSGVFDYEPSRERAYCRGTSAHNVPQLGERDQCDVWSKFRMGRRGRPLGMECGQHGDWNWAVAAHDAWKPCGIARTARAFLARTGGPRVCVESFSDQAPEPLRIRWHLHPAVTAGMHDDGRVVLNWPGEELLLTPPAPGTVSIQPCDYFPEFGRGVPSTAIVCELPESHGTLAVWSISRADDGWNLDARRNASSGTIFVTGSSARASLQLELPDLSIGRRR